MYSREIKETAMCSKSFSCVTLQKFVIDYYGLAIMMLKRTGASTNPCRTAVYVIKRSVNCPLYRNPAQLFSCIFPAYYYKFSGDTKLVNKFPKGFLIDGVKTLA